MAAGIINNTPVVAVFVPMITGLADRAGLSPSKLLLPLSYAAMMGGTLTLIGTSTNRMVYGPGGYRFTDYLRVGGPLQLLLVVVVTLGIAALFGVSA